MMRMKERSDGVQTDDDDSNNDIDNNNKNDLMDTDLTDDEFSENLPPQGEFEKMAKHLFCGGVAGCVGKTVTAPFSRLTILYQVHSMVTTKENRPNYASSMRQGMLKIVERGGVMSLWQGNGTSVLHRFPFSAINFYCYERMLPLLADLETHGIRSSLLSNDSLYRAPPQGEAHASSRARFLAGASAGCTACVCCYPLDLVRTRITTELPDASHRQRNYRNIADSFRKIYAAEGVSGFYSGIGPTLAVAVPNFALSYTVYGSLKEHVLDDELFYNLRRVDAASGETTLNATATILIGATAGCLSTLLTFPADTVRRRMQIQNLHVPPEQRLSAHKQFLSLKAKEGFPGLYRGITPELVKVVPMVSSMFWVYESLKSFLQVGRGGRSM